MNNSTSQSSNIPTPTHDPRMGIEVVKEEEWEVELIKMCNDTTLLAGLSGGRFHIIQSFIRKIRQDVYREAYAQGIFDGGKHNEEAAKEERARLVKEIKNIDEESFEQYELKQKILSLLTSKE